MSAPVRISVVTPLYNKAPFVIEAINSALRQSYPPAEVIVVDDGSTDGGPDLVKQLNNPFIKLVSQANAGVSAARNRGIDLASGDYIAFLDADDRYRPGFLSQIANLADRYPNAGMICTGYTCFWDDGHHEDRTLRSAKPNELLCIQDFYASWARCTFTCTIAIAIANRFLATTGLRFPVGEKLGEDQDFWFRAAELAPVAYANTPLADYRMGVAGSATQSLAIRDVLPCYHRLGERLARGQVPAHMRRGAKRLLASHLLNLAHANLEAGNRQKAANYLADRRSLANPFYFFRTLIAIAFAAPRADIRT